VCMNRALVNPDFLCRQFPHAIRNAVKKFFIQLDSAIYRTIITFIQGKMYSYPFHLIVARRIMNSLNEQKTHTSFVRRMTDRIRRGDKSEFTVFLNCLPQFLQMKISNKYKQYLMLIL